MGKSKASLKAIIPPNAEVSSEAKAFSYASKIFFPKAIPQGFACFTMTQAGSEKLFTHSYAASVSAILL